MLLFQCFDPNNIKIDGKSYKNISIYYSGYVMIKDLEYVKSYSVNPFLYLSFDQVNGNFEEFNKGKYLKLVSTNESKWKVKKHEELIKIKELIRSIIKISDNYDEIYMKIKFHLDEKLPPNKTIEIDNACYSYFSWK